MNGLCRLRGETKGWNNPAFSLSAPNCLCFYLESKKLDCDPCE